MQKISCGESKKSNILNFTERVNQEKEPKGNFKQYGVLIDQICRNKTPTANDAKRLEIRFNIYFWKDN